MERLGYGVVMASYKDYLNGKIRIDKHNISKAVSTLSAVANKRLKRIEAAGWSYSGAPIEVTEGTIAGQKKFGARGKTTTQLISEFKRVKQFLDNPLSTVTGTRKQAKEFGIQVESLYSHMRLREKRARDAVREEAQQAKQESDEYVRYRELSDWEKKGIKRAKKSEQTRAARMGEDFDIEGSEEEWFDDWYNGITFYNYLVSNKIYAPSTNDSDQAREIAQEIVTEYKYEFGSQEEMINEFKRRMGMVVEDYEESERIPQPEGGTSSFIFGDNE